MDRLTTQIAAVMLFVLVALTVAPALAQSTVHVRVRAPGGESAEAVVTLTPEGGGASHSCRTSGGACTIASVPAGRYVVTAEPLSGGRAPIPRPVPVPDGIEVTVHVSLR